MQRFCISASSLHHTCFYSASESAAAVANEHVSPQEPSKKFKGDVMDLRLDIERRKRFAGKESKREGGRSPGGSRGASREKSSEKSGKHHKKSKYVERVVSVGPPGTSGYYGYRVATLGDLQINNYLFLLLVFAVAPNSICDTLPRARRLGVGFPSSASLNEHTHCDTHCLTHTL